MNRAPDAARFTAPMPSVEAIAGFAAAYAEQTDRDYDALVKAAKEKRIRVAT